MAGAPIDVTSPRSPTAELHRLRRAELVDGAAFFGFAAAFAYAGTDAMHALWRGLLFGSPIDAMLRFVGVLVSAGVAGALAGAGAGYLTAAVWRRVDLRRNPRRYEPLVRNPDAPLPTSRRTP